MAEYYPLLAKAVGSLSNSTPESRRIVYERARKALIGQLRTLHPPVPDEDIDRESEALDRAIERLEGELATGAVPVAPPAPPPSSPPVASPLAPAKPPAAVKPPASRTPLATETTRSSTERASTEPGGALSSDLGANNPAVAPLRSKLLGSKPVPDGAAPPPTASSASGTELARSGGDGLSSVLAEEAGSARPLDLPKSAAQRAKAARGDGSRPIAPQPPAAKGPKRRLWIIPVAVGLVVASVAYFAWKLRDRPETIATKGKPAEQTQADSGKIAERVGGSPQASGPAQPKTPAPQASTVPAAGSSGSTATPTDAPAAATSPAPNNPELPVAHRAALLVEAPNEPNKVKTFLGTVVWKLNNVPQGPNDAVGLAVEADIEIPDDKMKVVVTFAKNTEASLPASHTVNIRYTIDGGSYTGDVKQISVPQMRPESSASGEPLAGVTVQIVPNSFLVGLSPGNAESVNTDLLKRLQWVDIPMLLASGKIAKLTFEKSDSGQRDLTEAIDSWQKP